LSSSCEDGLHFQVIPSFIGLSLFLFGFIPKVAFGWARPCFSYRRLRKRRWRWWCEG
jgi:hypothetical protein